MKEFVIINSAGFRELAEFFKSHTVFSARVSGKVYRICRKPEKTAVVEKTQRRT